MSAWKLPLAIIALVGFGIFCITDGWYGGRNSAIGSFPFGGMAFMGALFLYKAWSRKSEKDD